MTSAPAIHLAGVRLVRDAVVVLDDVTWTVGRHERWVILGPNGSGKTSLLQLVTGYLHPTRGSVSVLGERLGRTDVRRLRRRIALASGAVTRSLPAGLSALDVAVTGRTGSLAPWWDEPDAELAAAATELLGADLAHRPFAVLSEGERQRVQLVRMRLAAAAELLVFDEPAAGLDLAARERLVADLARLAADPTTPPILFVTHHVEEIPPAFTSLLLLREGRVVAAGGLAETLTAARLSETFGLPLVVSAAAGRYSARQPARSPDATKGRSADPAL